MAAPRSVEASGQAVELRRIEPADRADDDLALHQLGLVDEGEAGRGGPDEDDAAVVGHADALDEALLLHAVDDPGGARHRGVEDLGQAAHRHRVVVTQQREHVEMGHADPEPNQALRSRAAKGADGPAEVRERLVGRLLPLRAGIRVDSGSHVMKYLRHANSSVKRNCQRKAEESRARAVRADDRAPDGPHLRRPAGRRAAGRGGRVRDVLPVRPLRELPGRDRPADDRRLGGARRAGPRDDPDRPRRPRLAGDVPDARQPRQGRRHRRRDERRPGRGRGGGRLARERAPAPRLPVPADRGAGRHARGDARDPARPVGGAGRLVVPRRALHGR